MKHRILLSTSRALRPPGAWGQAAVQLLSEGHKIVATLGFEPADHWPYKDKPHRLPSNIRTLMPEQVSVSTGAIREYSAYRRSAGYAETHGMLLLMMSRVDSTGTFRSLEREVLARKIHLEIFTALAETKLLDGTGRAIETSRRGFSAKFTGLSKDNATKACARLQVRQYSCEVTGQ